MYFDSTNSGQVLKEKYTGINTIKDIILCLDSGQDSKSSNNNSKKGLRAQQIYTRGSGPLRKSAEPESTMADEPGHRNDNNTEDTSELLIYENNYLTI